MFRMLFATAVAMAAATLPALADAGLHHHPHGIEYGWIVAAGIGALAAVIVSYLRGRR